MNTAIDQQQNISMTETAIAHVRKQLQKREHIAGLRLGVKKVGCSGFGYVVDFVEQPSADDYRFAVTEDITVFVDPKSFPMLKGTRLDYIRQGLNAGFEFHNPNATGTCGCGESFSTN